MVWDWLIFLYFFLLFFQLYELHMCQKSDQIFLKIYAVGAFDWLSFRFGFIFHNTCRFISFSVSLFFFVLFFAHIFLNVELEIKLLCPKLVGICLL